MFGGAQPPLMYKFKNLCFSFLVLPLLGTAFAGNPLMAIPAALGGTQLADNAAPVVSEEELTRIEHAAKIDAFFEEHDMPLAGTGRKMVEVAEANGLDWNLLPAIAVQESTGGIQKCKSVSNSVFGFGSCKISFKSIDASIEIVGAHLGGNKPATAKYYKDKDLAGILRSYNSERPTYLKEVVRIMKMIAGQDLNQNIAETEASAQQS